MIPKLLFHTVPGFGNSVLVIVLFFSYFVLFLLDEVLCNFLVG